ncbi:MAG: hypothetical protein Q8Q09_07905 [Deltaproteobacteria bacterium]|nr:hypothetical protein [Deltaproteobacteria bacterium]
MGLVPLLESFTLQICGSLCLFVWALGRLFVRKLREPRSAGAISLRSKRALGPGVVVEMYFVVSTAPSNAGIYPYSFDYLRWRWLLVQSPPLVCCDVQVCAGLRCPSQARWLGLGPRDSADEPSRCGMRKRRSDHDPCRAL